MILKIGYLSDYNSKLLDFVSLDSYFYQLFVDIRRISSSFDPSIWRLTEHCSFFIRIQTLTFEVNYFQLTNQNSIILVSLDFSGS